MAEDFDKQNEKQARPRVQNKIGKPNQRPVEEVKPVKPAIPRPRPNSRPVNSGAPQRPNKAGTGQPAQQKPARPKSDKAVPQAKPTPKPSIPDTDVDLLNSEVEKPEPFIPAKERKYNRAEQSKFEKNEDIQGIKTISADQLEGGDFAVNSKRSKRLRKKDGTITKEKGSFSIVEFLFKGKRKFITIAGALLLIIICGVMFGGKKGKADYFSLWDSIFKQELGSFRYVVEVQSHPSNGELSLTDISLDDLSNMGENGGTKVGETKKGSTDSGSGEQATQDGQTSEQATDSTEAPAETTPTPAPQEGTDLEQIREAKEQLEQSKLTDWTTSEGISEEDSHYSNFRIVVEGKTLKNGMSDLETEIVVTLATKNFASTLTTITIKDGTIWFDLEQLYYWLHSSKDSYLVELSKQLPSNSKYLKVPLAEFKLKSGFAEESENEGLANNPLLWWRCRAADLRAFISGMKAIGTNSVKEEDGVYKLHITTQQGSELLNTARSILSNRSDLFSSANNAKQEIEGFDDNMKAQAENERDNFLAATSQIYRALMCADLKDLNLEAGGSARSYEDTTGVSHVEAMFNTIFTANGTDYSIVLAGERNGNGGEIETPTGTEATLDQQTYYDVLADMVDYLNPTMIDLRTKLDMTPTEYNKDMQLLAIKYINDNMGEPIIRNMLDLARFMGKYTNYKEDESTTDVDRKAVEVLKSFTKAYAEYNANFSSLQESDTPTEQVDDTKKYDEVSWTDSMGILYKAKIKEDETADKLVVIELTMELNNSNITDSASVGVDVLLSDFKLMTESGGIYPINSEDALLSYENGFDVAKLQQKVHLENGDKKVINLYAVASGGVEKMNLYYKDDDLGTIILRK